MPVGAVVLGVRTWRPDVVHHPPLVLLPGTGDTAEAWDVVAPALASARLVHAVDLRGHGASDRPGRYSIALMAGDVAALLPRLPDGQVDLVGHSLGGLVALDVAAAHPGLVRRLVLEDVGLLRPRAPAPPARPPGDLAFDWRVVEQVRPEIDDPDPRWRAVVAGVRAPALVIGGGPTSHVPQEQVADLARALPDGHLMTIEAGHLVHDVEPERFVEVVETFLTSG
ncbi:alpha/beta hydrolase [Angustibacter aerolatus]